MEGQEAKKGGDFSSLLAAGLLGCCRRWFRRREYGEALQQCNRNEKTGIHVGLYYAATEYGMSQRR